MRTAFIWVAVVSILWTCTLEPEDVYFNEIKEPNPKGFISLNESDLQDTIYLYRDATFTYDLSIDQGEVQQVRIRYGNEDLFWGSSTSGKFTLQGSALKTGTFQLTIEFIAKTNSGSLADVVGAEKFRLWREWVVIVDVDPPPPPVLKLSNENGFLKLSWTPYTKPNFVRYEVRIEYNNNVTKSVFIDQADQSFWIDSSYVGGYNANYRLSTLGVSRAYSETSYVNDRQELQTSYRASDSTIFLTWRKCKYAGAFQHYKVSVDRQETLITNINDTTFSYQLKEVVFQKDARVHFNVKPRYPAFVPYGWEKMITNTAGASQLERFTSILYYNDVIKKLVGYRNGYFIFFNDEIQKTDSVQNTNSSYIYNFASPYIYFSGSGSVGQMDLRSKDVKMSAVEVPTGYTSGPAALSGAGNGIVSYRLVVRRNAFYAYLRIYNFETEQLIEEKQSVTISTSNIASPLYVSGQGTYLFSFKNKEVYRFNSTSYELIGTVPSSGSFYSFRDDDNSEILMKSFNTLSIVNTDNLTVSRTITFPTGTSLIMYDPGSHYALFAADDSERIYLINIDTQETKIIKASTKGYAEKYRLINGFLFAGDEYLKVL